MKSTYSTVDLARILDVNESTVKRWADNGHIECVRTRGGHRRFTVGALLKYAQENQISIPSLDTTVLNDVDLHAHVVAGNISKLIPELKRACLDGSIDSVLKILRIAMAARPDLLRVYTELVFPPLAEIGEEWASGTLTVDEEHLASHTMNDAVVRLQSEIRLKSANGKTLVAACYEDDLHDLGLRCASNYFATEGWRVVFLGQSTPTDSILHAIEKHRPNLVIVSTVMLKNKEKFVKVVNANIAPAIHAINGALNIGGRDVRSRFSSNVTADSFADTILDYEQIARAAS
jgi:excisionase family DNA binding protein